jgi:acyl-CoA thioesterase-1
MKTVWGYVGLLLIVQLAASCSPEAAPPSEQQPTNVTAGSTEQTGSEKLVLALGDSLYAGYGLKQDQSFPAVLEQELDAAGLPTKVVNAGVSGDTTAGGRARLAFTLDGLQRKPDLAIVGLGANDALRGIDPAETRANLDAIVGELDRRGIAVLLTGMMAPRNLGSAYVNSFDAIYPALAKKYDAQLDPFFLDGVITRSDLLLNDGIHPNDAGLRIMARRIAPLAADQLKGAK